VPFRTIAGHSRLLSLLARVIARDSMPPAVLMAGPAGVGKRLTAIAIAQVRASATRTTSAARQRIRARRMRRVRLVPPYRARRSSRRDRR